MAAGAVARKFVDGSSKLAEWFLAKLSGKGWVALPYSALENMDRKLSPSEGSIYRHIFRLTIGNHQQNRPEQIRITHDEFAEWANIDKRQVTKALKFLRENKVIDGEERGRYVLYSILDFTLAGLPDRVARTLDRDAEAEEVPEEQTAEQAAAAWAPLHIESGPIKPGGTFKFKDEKTGQTVKVTANKAFATPIDTILKRVKGNWDILLTPGPAQGVTLASAQTGTKGKRDHGTPVPLSFSSPLSEALTPIFAERFHQAPDDQLLRKVAADLGKTPVAYFIQAIVHPKLQSKYKVTPGLFIGTGATPGLGKEAAQKWAKLPEDFRRAYLPQPKPVAQRAVERPFEDESSDSAWMRIRLALKAKLHAQEYANWLEDTCFVSFKAGELVVRTTSAVQNDFLEQEYGELIRQASESTGVHFKSIRYVEAN